MKTPATPPNKRTALPTSTVIWSCKSSDRGVWDQDIVGSARRLNFLCQFSTPYLRMKGISFTWVSVECLLIEWHPQTDETDRIDRTDSVFLRGYSWNSASGWWNWQSWHWQKLQNCELSPTILYWQAKVVRKGGSQRRMRCGEYFSILFVGVKSGN